MPKTEARSARGFKLSTKTLRGVNLEQHATKQYYYDSEQVRFGGAFTWSIHFFNLPDFARARG